MKRILLLLLPLLLLTTAGCSEDKISDRLYTRALGLGGRDELTLYAQTFNEDGSFSAEGTTAAQALYNGETIKGSRIFVGHTELLCLDGSHTLAEAQQLLFSHGLSPACKVFYTSVRPFFKNEDSSKVLHRIRISEQNGHIAETELSTILNEWLGIGETALLPARSNDDLGMVLLHRDGSCTPLSDQASRGMYWLRQNGDGLTVTVDTKDIKVLRSSLEKEAVSGNLRFTLTIHTEDTTVEEREALQETVLLQCRTAISEMQDAKSDVIGLQELLESQGLSFDPAVPPEIEMNVNVR